MNHKLHHSPFNIVVLAAGLGFFIDTFDLFLFNVYRIPSLKELGYAGEELTRMGEYLLSAQMLGMMVGGLVSGVIADKRGRVSVLFGSIVVYSLANILNGFVDDVNSYAIIRFFAGMGLAGELGAGITLVGESMSIEKRGYGTIFVATLGGLGAVTAGLAGDFLPWRSAFIFAGIAGFLVLLLRMKAMETGIFQSARQSAKHSGSFFHLFQKRERAMRYIACIIMGVPIWYSVGLWAQFVESKLVLYPVPMRCDSRRFVERCFEPTVQKSKKNSIRFYDHRSAFYCMALLSVVSRIYDLRYGIAHWNRLRVSLGFRNSDFRALRN